MDVFTFDAVDLDDLTSLRLGHDGKGIGSGWKVDKIVVKPNRDEKLAFLFKVDRWFDEGEDDGKIERDVTLTRVVGRDDVTAKGFSNFSILLSLLTAKFKHKPVHRPEGGRW